MNEDVSFSNIGGYSFKKDNWEAYSTAIKARDIARLYKKHKTTLFSANIRDYLGSRNANTNINHGIKSTIEDESENFWAYNNGITVLTNGFEVNDKQINLHGMSIVNGAQTTGAIGSNTKLPKPDAYIHVRIIAVKNKKTDLIENIIRFNNSQNQVEASDFRSTDSIQLKLKNEFNSIEYAKYEAGRRGSNSDKIQRKNKLLESYSVGQALTAFHGDPISAYNKKREIWSNNTLYNRIFNDSTSAEHIIFCYTLIKAIEEQQLIYKRKSNLTKLELNILSFLRQRGSKFLLAYAISFSLDTILSKKTNIQSVSFNGINSLKEGISIWSSILKIILPYSYISLNDAVSNGLKNTKEIEKCVENFVAQISVAVTMHDDLFEPFKNRIKF